MKLFHLYSKNDYVGFVEADSYTIQDMQIFEQKACTFFHGTRPIANFWSTDPRVEVVLEESK